MLASRAARAAWHLASAWTFPGTETPPDRVEVVGANSGVELELGGHIRQFGRTVQQIDLAAIPDDPLAAGLDYFVRCIRRRRAADPPRSPHGRPRQARRRCGCHGLARQRRGRAGRLISPGVADRRLDRPASSPPLRPRRYRRRGRSATGRPAAR
ncbi:MAG: hypothetical protein U1E53_03965 [Dongiaceae bacterium]